MSCITCRRWQPQVLFLILWNNLADRIADAWHRKIYIYMHWHITVGRSDTLVDRFHLKQSFLFCKTIAYWLDGFVAAVMMNVTLTIIDMQNHHIQCVIRLRSSLRTQPYGIYNDFRNGRWRSVRKWKNNNIFDQHLCCCFGKKRSIRMLILIQHVCVCVCAKNTRKLNLFEILIGC